MLREDSPSSTGITLSFARAARGSAPAPCRARFEVHLAAYMQQSRGNLALGRLQAEIIEPLQMLGIASGTKRDVNNWR
jgi:hypothetical protein